VETPPNRFEESSVRRLTAAVLALACMGVVAGGAALVDARPVQAKAVENQWAGAGSMAALPAAATTAEKQSAAGRYSQQAHVATNNRRTDHGLKALRRTGCVQRFAVKQAAVMARAEHMDHQALQPILESCGLSGVGENVAYGYPNGRSVVNDGWMKSEGHRANMLNPEWRLMGIGARKGHNGVWYVSQVFGRKS
jgi:uncharacterized protein YkwD